MLVDNKSRRIAMSAACALFALPSYMQPKGLPTYAETAQWVVFVPKKTHRPISKRQKERQRRRRAKTGIMH